MLLRTRLALTLLLAIVCASAALAPVGAARQTGRRSVSLVLTGGKVFTADARGTLAEAVAVEGNRIVAVGTSREIAAAYTAARTIDLKGRLVTPGFNDAHLHFLGGGLSLLRVEPRRRADARRGEGARRGARARAAGGRVGHGARLGPHALGRRVADEEGFG